MPLRPHPALHAAAAGLLVGALACGDPPPPAPIDAAPAWTADTPEGAAIFASCASCHMPDAGGRTDGSIPRLAGQRADVLEARLIALQQGHVHLPVMAPFARSLSLDEVRQVSAWLATLPPPAQVGVGPGDALDAGGTLYAERCAGCHGAAAEGAPGIPNLCGQHADYVLRRIDEIASKARADADPAMSAIAAAMSPADRAAVADHLSRGACTPAGEP
jgi:cytochrome c553